MQKKEEKKMQETDVIKSEIVLQSFKVLKEFPTAKKVYQTGDDFKHHDKKVIDYLKNKKII